MKKRCLILLVILCLTFGALPVSAAQETLTLCPEGVEVVGYNAEADYLSLMEECAREGTQHAIMLGALYERQRNLKIESSGHAYAPTDFFDCFDGQQILAKIEQYQNPPPQKAYDCYYTDQDIEIIAKVLYREARGIPSNTKKACIAWTICNRLDAGAYGDSIAAVALAPNQFAYSKNTPVTDELYWLACDVLDRWNKEKNGEMEVGRVLPASYLWYSGDGQNNWFRNAYRGGSTWRYTLPTPYEN